MAFSIASLLCLLVLLNPAALVLGKRRLKVLYYVPSLGYSHVQFNGRLAEALVNAGHEVHLLMPEVDPTVGAFNGTNKAAKVFRFPTAGLEAFRNARIVSNYFDGGYFAFTRGAKQFWLDVVQLGCEATLRHSTLLAELKREHYDLAVGEALSYCPFALFHHLEIRPTLATTAIPLQPFVAETFGLQHHPSYMAVVGQALVQGERLSLPDRLRNLYIRWHELAIDNAVHMRETALVRELWGPEFPDLRLLLGRVSFVFTNGHPVLSFPRPLTHKVVHVGGSAIPHSKPLSDPLATIVDRAPKGVVLFSFGSLANTKRLSVEKHAAFASAFGRFPEHTFVWKVSSEALERAHTAAAPFPNVHVVAWVDQTSLLTHPRTVAFITQCGLNSLYEAAFAGVPLVAVPLFSDQFYNAAVVRQKSVGVVLDIGDLSEESVVDALHQVLDQSSFRDNMTILQRKLRLFPSEPLQEFVKRVEYAAEFPDFNEWNLASLYLDLFAIFYLDALVLLLIVLLAIFFSFRWLCCGGALAQKVKSD